MILLPVLPLLRSSNASPRISSWLLIRLSDRLPPVPGKLLLSRSVYRYIYCMNICPTLVVSIGGKCRVKWVSWVSQVRRHQCRVMMLNHAHLYSTTAAVSDRLAFADTRLRSETAVAVLYHQ